MAGALCARAGDPSRRELAECGSAAREVCVVGLPLCAWLLLNTSRWGCELTDVYACRHETGRGRKGIQASPSAALATSGGPTPADPTANIPNRPNHQPQVKVLRETDRLDADGLPRSKGLGFVEFR